MSQNRMNSIKFPMRLKSLAAVASAVSFWERQEIKKAVKNYFLREFNESCPKPYEGNWIEIGRKIIKMIERLDIPTEATSELKDMVFFIGEKVYWWTVHIYSELTLDIKYAEEIYWTPNGNIDEIKIFQLYWISGSFLKKRNFEDFLDSNTMLILSCVLAQEKFIRKNLSYIADSIINLYDPFIVKCSKMKVNIIMALAVCYVLADGQAVKAFKLYKSLKESSYNNAADILFELCSSSHMKEAAEYFFNKLKDQDKENLLNEASTKFVMTAFNERNGYKILQVPELLLFLINRMSDMKRYEFLKENGAQCFQIFIKAWPYQELCLPMLNFIWNELEEIDQEFVLSCIINVLLSDFKKCDVNKKNCRRILQNVLGKCSEKLKIAKFIEEKKIVFDLFKASDYSTIIIIINDVDLVDYKDEVTDITSHLSEFLLHNGKLMDIDNYMEGLKFSLDEKKKFKSKCDFLSEFTMRRETVLCNDFLKWKFNLDSEKVATKKRLKYLESLSDQFSVIMLNKKKY